MEYKVHIAHAIILFLQYCRFCEDKAKILETRSSLNCISKISAFLIL